MDIHPLYGSHVSTQGTGHADAAATRAANAAERAEQSEKHFENELARLHLACRAMWEIIRIRTGSTDDELLRMMEAVDLSDGKLDGRVNVESVTCTQCERRMGKRHKQCMYCGTPRAQNEPF